MSLLATHYVADGPDNWQVHLEVIPCGASVQLYFSTCQPFPHASRLTPGSRFDSIIKFAPFSKVFPGAAMAYSVRPISQVCEELLKIHFGDVAASVGSYLLRRGNRSVVDIVSATGLSTNEVLFTIFKLFVKIQSL